MLICRYVDMLICYRICISPACWYVDMLAFHRHVGISPACWYVSQIEFTSQVPAQLAVKTCLTIWFKILKYWKGRHERQNKVSQKRGLFLPTGRAVQPATVHLILFDENVGHDYWGKNYHYYYYYYSKEEWGEGAGKNPARNADPKAAPTSLPAPYVALRFWWP